MKEARNLKSEFLKWKEWRAVGANDPDAREPQDLEMMQSTLNAFIAMLEGSDNTLNDVEFMLSNVHGRYDEDFEMRKLGVRMPDENDPDR